MSAAFLAVFPGQIYRIEASRKFRGDSDLVLANVGA